MTERTREYVALAILSIVMLVVLWHFWPVLIEVETGRGLLH